MRAPQKPTVPKHTWVKNWPSRWVVAIAALALVLRVVHVLALRESPYFLEPAMDSAYHAEWARAVMSGETFQEGPFFRAPLYVWFLSLLQYEFGPGLLGPRLAQCLLGVVTTLLTHRIAARLFDRLAAHVAAFLVATSWVLIHFDGELLIPALAIPLNLLALLWTIDLGKRPTMWHAERAGLAWGLAAIARPNVLLFVPVVALWLALRKTDGRRARLSLVLVGTTLLPILPLTAYNRIMGGDWVLISSQAGVNLWIGNNPASDGSTAIVPGTRGGWWEGYYDAIAQAEESEGRPLKPSEVSAHYSARALDWMTSHPGDAFRHLLWKLRLFWTRAELGNNLDVTFFALHFDPLLKWSPSRFDVLVGLAVLGLALCLRRGRETFPLWGFLATYCLGVVAFFVCSRFRAPILPVLCIFSGAGVTWLVAQFRSRRWVPLLGALAMAGTIGGLTNLRPASLRSSEGVGFLQLAQARAAAGEHEHAARDFERALEEGGNNPQVLYGLAMSSRALGDRPRALRLVRDGLAIPMPPGAAEPYGLPELRGLLVALLVETGKGEEALRTANGFLEQRPGDVMVLYGRALALQALGDLEAADRDLAQVVRLAPDLTVAWLARAELAEARGEPAEAERYRARGTRR